MPRAPARRLREGEGGGRGQARRGRGRPHSGGVRSRERREEARLERGHADICGVRARAGAQGEGRAGGSRHIECEPVRPSANAAAALANDAAAYARTVASSLRPSVVGDERIAVMSAQIDMLASMLADSTGKFIVINETVYTRRAPEVGPRIGLNHHARLDLLGERHDNQTRLGKGQRWQTPRHST